MPIRPKPFPISLPNHFAQLSTRPLTISPNCQLAPSPFRPIVNSPLHHFAQLSTFLGEMGRGHWAKWGLAEMKELGEMASGRNEKWAK
jgi:hypothetical protein